MPLPKRNAGVVQRVEKDILEWISQGPMLRAHSRDDEATLLRDVNLLLAADTTVPAFAAQHTPITARDFECLDELRMALGIAQTSAASSLGYAARLLKKPIPHAVMSLEHARELLLQRCPHWGIPIHALLPKAPKDPDTQVTLSRRIHAQVKQRLSGDKAAIQVANPLLKNLQDAVDLLDTLLAELAGHHTDAAIHRTRAAAAKALLANQTRHLCRWGKVLDDLRTSEAHAFTMPFSRAAQQGSKGKRKVTGANGSDGAVDGEPSQELGSRVPAPVIPPSNTGSAAVDLGGTPARSGSVDGQVVNGTRKTGKASSKYSRKRRG